MLNPEFYQGREQTYVKHFFLDKYLEKVVFNICSFSDRFVYVDGFSGPWKSADQNYSDTSFKISVDRLHYIKEGLLKDKGKHVHFKCLFIEKDPAAFKELEGFASQIQDIELKLINGAFENHIDDIRNFVGRDFSLIFIDPTGWTGFPFEKIHPLFNLRGEILINFMYDHINRFLDHPSPEIAAGFNELFGADWFPKWKKLNQLGLSREAAAIEVYTSKLKSYGGFEHVTYTRILKPLHNRSYFHLIYTTKHWKGLLEFRHVEEKAVEEQEKIRTKAKAEKEAEKRVLKTGMQDMFDVTVSDNTIIKTSVEERSLQRQVARKRLIDLILNNPFGILYEDVLGEILEMPLVWEKDIKELKSNGDISITGMTDRQQVPKTKMGNMIFPK